MDSIALSVFLSNNSYTKSNDSRVHMKYTLIPFCIHEFNIELKMTSWNQMAVSKAARLIIVSCSQCVLMR